MAKQTEAIRSALGEPMISEFDIETRAALCFVNAEWSLFAKPMLLNGVWVGWGRAPRTACRTRNSRRSPDAPRRRIAYVRAPA